MTRLNSEEKKQPSSQAKIPKELKQKNRKVLKMKHKRSNKFTMAMIIIIVIFFVGTAMAAQTGIWQIPIFTQIFYQIPEPIRVVDVAGVSGLNQQQAVFDPEENILRIVVTEKELTAAIKQQLVNNIDPPFAQNAQIVITSKEIEFFGYLLKPFSANLTIRVRPLFTDEKIDYKISQAKIGSLNLPPFLVDWGLKTYIAVRSKGKSDTNLKQVEFYRDKVKAESFKLEEGKMSMEIFIDVKAITDPVSENIDKLIDTFTKLDPEEIEKINNFDFESLTEETLKILKAVNITTEVLEKFKDLNLNPPANTQP
ncbi:MAG: hypothetical protein CMI53_05080 [Parcubacteria group bacterium]|jgi:hypothetical protein|nr:hypothetical protein [Parcubacteria group bacterium]|tara:strand:+ start:4793 stop:5725 length:933 start_codon:yes stop_codon:yes gene_type:complete